MCVLTGSRPTVRAFRESGGSHLLCSSASMYPSTELVVLAVRATPYGGTAVELYDADGALGGIEASVDSELNRKMLEMTNG